MKFNLGDKVQLVSKLAHLTPDMIGVVQGVGEEYSLIRFPCIDDVVFIENSRLQAAKRTSEELYADLHAAWFKSGTRGEFAMYVVRYFND